MNSPLADIPQSVPRCLLFISTFFLPQRTDRFVTQLALRASRQPIGSSRHLTGSHPPQYCACVLALRHSLLPPSDQNVAPQALLYAHAVAQRLLCDASVTTTPWLLGKRALSLRFARNYSCSGQDKLGLRHGEQNQSIQHTAGHFESLCA